MESVIWEKIEQKFKQLENRVENFEMIVDDFNKIKKNLILLKGDIHRLDKKLQDIISKNQGGDMD